MPSKGSSQGQTFSCADGGVIKNMGEKTVTMYPENTELSFGAKFQITDVTKALLSVAKIADQEKEITFTKTGGWIWDSKSDEYVWFPREGNTYMLHWWTKEDEPASRPFGRQEV